MFACRAYFLHTGPLAHPPLHVILSRIGMSFNELPLREESYCDQAP